MAGLVTPLREELTLHEGPRNADGSPSWTIHDPVSNRFYRIGWEHFEILLRWSLRHPDQIAAAIQRETTLTTIPATIHALERLLANHHLLQPVTSSDRQRWMHTLTRATRGGMGSVLSRLLFFRIPLFHPDPLLQGMIEHLSWLFSWPTLLFIIGTTLTGLILTLEQWETFRSSFMDFLTPSGMLLYGITFMMAKSAHELGHALSARYFGCRVATIGVAFVSAWPVLYTETNEVWKLPEKKKRLIVGASGILVELGLAGMAMFSWHFLPEGHGRDAAFLLATTTWVWTWVINLNPLMRFDGYFLLCDLLDLPNLHPRAFAMGRWWLRERLFGPGAAPPEPCSATRRRFLVFFSLATWAYRTMLFLMIALFVYHLFFKLLGVLLFWVALHEFLIKPVLGEIKIWMSLPGTQFKNGHALTTGLITLLLILQLFIPWSSDLNAPATLRAQRHTLFHAAEAGRLEQLPVVLGQKVDQGTLLFQLTAPERMHEARSIATTIDQIRWQLQAPGTRKLLLENEFSLRSQLEYRLAEYHALTERIARLTVTAPFPGEVVDLEEHLVAGDWIAENELLLTLADRTRGLIEAILPAEHHPLPRVGDEGTFKPEQETWPIRRCRLTAVGQTTLATLPEPMLAATYGGPLVVLPPTHDGRLIPKPSQLHATCLPDETSGNVPQIIRGTLCFQIPGEAPMVRLGRWLYALMVRESGF
ncbi:MAG: peptidase M50 [Magnetococcales bacterium]|nr:peptidase M50 [Magnetococcales bacterium]MBF0150673.1 peptidase M50 [Magnetococcales bacterium]